MRTTASFISAPPSRGPSAGPRRGWITRSRNACAACHTGGDTDRGSVMAKVQKTEEEWRSELGAEQYRVLREKGTERPFSGEYDHVFEDGTYRCAGCGAELFQSETKYDSGC